MSNLPARSSGAFGAGELKLRSRDARALDHHRSEVAVRAAGGIARIDAVADQYDEVLRENTRLTRTAMQHTVEVSQLEQFGSQLCPGAAARLEYLADQHTVSEAAILGDARVAMRRTIQ